MKRKSQFCYVATDVTTWKTLVKSGFKTGNYFTSDFFSATVAASGKTDPVIGIVEFDSEDGLSNTIRTDSWGRNSLYSVDDAKKFHPISLRLLNSNEVQKQIDELKQKGHDFSWLLTKLKLDSN